MNTEIVMICSKCDFIETKPDAVLTKSWLDALAKWGWSIDKEQSYCPICMETVPEENL